MRRITADHKLLIDGQQVQGAAIASTYWQRLFGLLGSTSLDPDVCLWFDMSGGIHTIGMLYPIDVVFLDGQQRVHKISPDIAPFRAVMAPKATRCVLEFAAGRCHQLGLTPGQHVQLGSL